MEKTKIEWCDSSWNPITGCFHDCPYCYAKKIAHRYGGNEDDTVIDTETKFIILKEKMNAKSADGKKRAAAYPYYFCPTYHQYRLKDLKRKKFGKTIFVCSMSDMFGEWVPDWVIEEIFAECLKYPNHRYLFLTKNPQRYIDLIDRGILPNGENFWYGSTTTHPDANAFFAKGYNTFVSIEPILETFANADPEDIAEKIDWAILGAETGNRAEKVVPERGWIENIVEAFERRGKPVFMKDSMKPVWGEDIITQFPWDD